MKDSQAAKPAPDPATVPMLVEEKSADVGGIPVPAGMPVIGKVVHWESTPTFTDAAALLDAKAEVKPGQFVGIWHGNRSLPVLTVLQVTNCREINPNEEPELAVARDRLGLSTRYAKEGVSTRIFRLLEGPTIEELNIEVTAKGFSVKGEPQAPELLVRAGDPVVTLTEDLVAQTIGSLPNPDNGLQLGTVYGDKPVPVVFKPEMLQMHIGDFGNPGKGKSYSSGVLMEEALKWEIPTLVLDINGEMLDAAKALGGLVITLPDRAKFGLSLSLITSPELIQIAPNVQEGTVYAEVIELSHERLKTEKKGQAFSFDDLIAKMNETAKLNDVKGPSLGIAISRVRALEKDPIVGGNFDLSRSLKPTNLWFWIAGF